MSMKWIWGVGMFLGFTVSAAPAWAAACRGPATVLEPATGAAVADFKAWLDKHEEAQAGAALYLADLDNDGKNDFAAASIQGSGGYLYLTVYSRQPDGSFKERQGAPPPPKGVSTEGGWYQFMYRDPDSGESALFSRLCGKTYLSFSGSGEGARDSYLWETRGTQPACDSAWTAFIRADFKKRYDAKEYERANNLLAGFLTQCSQALDDTTRAWIANDLAITQYHLGNSRGCLEYAARAKKSPKVQRAARYNEGLCAKAAGNLPSDFSWLLDPALTSTNQLVWAKPFDMTLRALVPDLKTGNAGRLREAVAAGLGGPPDDKEVSEQRYVTASACVAHACVSKAMMWVDVQEHLGLVALNSAESLTGPAACDLAIASRLVGPKAIPAAFWRAFAEWRSRNNLGASDGCVSFIAEDGTARAITPP